MDNEMRQIAFQRVNKLFLQANRTFPDDPALAQRYVDLARRIAMSVRIRMPKEYRGQVCKHCKSFILPGANCQVRLQQRREPHVVFTCLVCGRHMRVLLKKGGTRYEQNNSRQKTFRQTSTRQ